MHESSQASNPASMASPLMESSTHVAIPVPPRERIASLDVLRGIAILGIFFVNMSYFAMPLMQAMFATDMIDQPLSEQVAWAFVKLFCEFKFISMFSLLFGAGMFMQLSRSQRANVPFTARYVRRSVILMIVGLMHGFLLWYGDILFLYGCIGLWLLLFARFSASTLFTTAACIAAGLAMMMAALTALQVTLGPSAQGHGSSWTAQETSTKPSELAQQKSAESSQDEQASVSTLQAVDDNTSNLKESEASVKSSSADSASAETLSFELPPFLRPLQPLADTGWDVTSPKWLAAERETYKRGTYHDIFVVRGATYLTFLLQAPFSYGWHVFIMFLVGCGLMKLEFFSPAGVALQRKLLFIGLPAGMLLAVASLTIVVASNYQMNIWMALASPMHELGGMVLCLGYVGGITLACTRGVLPRLQRAVGNVGRMALTNYLLTTIICTTIMYSYGLGRFGDFTRAQLLGLVLVIYLALLLLSHLWLSIFRYGPVEWLWRILTYLRWQPFGHESTVSPPPSG